jgi:hypothetical protein
MNRRAFLSALTGRLLAALAMLCCGMVCLYIVVGPVDLRSVQTLGGWRTLTMVQRYSHLAPQQSPGRGGAACRTLSCAGTSP